MFNIPKCCSEFRAVLDDTRDRNDFFNDLVKERLLDLCKKEDNDLDLLLRKLDSSISSGSNHQIKLFINKLYRVLYRDRNHLVTALWRMM